MGRDDRARPRLRGRRRAAQVLMKREEHALEFLDRPLPADVLAASLADLDHLNQRYGGHWLALREVMRRIDALPATGPPAPIVDVGGGRGGLALRVRPGGGGGGRPGP